MKSIMLVVAALLVTPLAAQAPAARSAPETNPVANAMRSILARESKIMVAAAEAMPPDKYDYHPTPAQMTFAHLIAHVSQSNNLLCSKISGEAPPSDQKTTDTDPKDKLVSAMKASFDYCTQVLAPVDDSNLGEQIPLFGNRTSSRAGIMFTLTNDFFDHYSAEAMYLRMNGILPPTAQPSKP